MTTKERAAVIDECVAVARSAATVFKNMAGSGRNDVQRTFSISSAAASSVADQIELLKEKR